MRASNLSFQIRLARGIEHYKSRVLSRTLSTRHFDSMADISSENRSVAADGHQSDNASPSLPPGTSRTAQARKRFVGAGRRKQVEAGSASNGNIEDAALVKCKSGSSTSDLMVGSG